MSEPILILKLVTYFGQPMAVACDAKCHKAWGINSRPKIPLDPTDEDDFVYLADDQLGDAPDDPGTYEGGDAKPQSPDARMNKWCVRECERCVRASMGTRLTYIGYAQRRYNQPWKHQEVKADGDR